MQQQQHNEQFLRAALAGYEAMLATVDLRISHIKQTLAPAAAAAPEKRSKMSAAGRRRVSQAQKKRWAAFHAAQKASAQ